MSALAQARRSYHDPNQLLHARVAELRQARQRSDAARLALRGVALGGLFAGLVGMAGQLVAFAPSPIAAAIVFVAIVVSLAGFGWRRQPSLLHVALEIDRLLRLDERITTALELTEQFPRSANPPSRETSLAGQQIADAAASLSLDATSSLYRLRVPRRAQALAAAGLVLAAIPWLVSWPVLIRSYLPPSPTEVVAQAEAARLETVARQLQNDPTAPDQPTRAAVAAQLQKAAAALRESNGNAQSASQALQSAQQAVLAAAPPPSEDASQTLARIADALNNNALTQSATQALDARDPTKAAAAMSQIAADLGSMTPQQRGDLANTLQSASNAARISDAAAADQLQQAAAAATSDNAAGVQQAAQALQQLGAASSAQQDIAQGRSELQASQESLASASQNGQSAAQAAASPDQSSPGQSANGGQTGPASQDASTTSSASGSTGQSSSSDTGTGSQPSEAGGSPGNGSGKGGPGNPSAPTDPEQLAQRQVTIPSNGQIDSGSLGLSSQREAPSTGTAQVDYADVLPQYRSQALQNISGSQVPTGLKQVVKGYFDSLAPSQ